MHRADRELGLNVGIGPNAQSPRCIDCGSSHTRAPLQYVRSINVSLGRAIPEEQRIRDQGRDCQDYRQDQVIHPH